MLHSKSCWVRHPAGGDEGIRIMSPRLTIVTSDAVLTYGRRGRAWIVGGLMGLLVGMGMHWATPPAYTATAVVELSEAAAIIDLSPVAARPRLLSVDTDAQIVTSDEVVAAVMAATGHPEMQVRRSLSVSGRPVTRVLEVSYRTSSADVATAGARQAAAVFLDERERLIVAPVRQYLVEVAARTESPRQPETLTEALTTADLSDARRSTVEGWRQRAVAARLALRDAGITIEAARITSRADRGDVEVPLATGACAGALLGLGFGLMRRHVAGRSPS